MDDMWTTNYADGGIYCDNDNFGDPYSGMTKECRCDDGSSMTMNGTDSTTGYDSGVV